MIDNEAVNEATSTELAETLEARAPETPTPQAPLVPAGWLVTKAELELAKYVDTEDIGRGTSNLAVSADCTEVTNGHYLIRVEGARPDADDYPVPGEAIEPPHGRTLLSKDAALAIAKTIPKRTRTPILGHAIVGKDAVATAGNLDGWTRRSAEDGATFPSTDLMVASVDARPVTVTLSLDAVYLKVIADAFVALGHRTYIGGHDGVCITLEIRAGDKPVTFKATTDDGRTVRAFLMPLRD